MSIKIYGLGRGWAYPVRRDPITGRPVFTEDEAKIKESIHSIIMTDVDERPFLMRDGVPYGTRVNRMIFAGVQTLRDVAVYDIKRALAVWEPRIFVNDVNSSVTRINDMLGVVIHVSFVYRDSNRPDNFQHIIQGVRDAG